MTSKGNDSKGNDNVEEILDLSELVFEFGDSGVRSSQAKTGLDVALDDTPEGQSLAGVTRGTQRTAATSNQNVAAVRIPTSERWYYQSPGLEMGPMSFAQLRGLAETGVITLQDEVRCSETGQWVPASSLPGLAMCISQHSELMPEDVQTKRANAGNTRAAEVRDAAQVSAPVAEARNIAQKKVKKKRPLHEDISKDLFDDVFAEKESKAKLPARHMTPSHSATESANKSTTDMAPLMDRQTTSPAPRTAVSTYSSPPAPAAYATPDQSVAPQKLLPPRPTTSKKSSGGRSLPVEPKQLAIIGASVLLLAAVGYWLFSPSTPGELPVGKFNATASAQVLSMIGKQVMALGNKATPEAWDEVSSYANFPLSDLVRTAEATGDGTPAAKACVAAAKALQNALAAGRDNKDIFKQSIAEVQKQLVLVK